MVVRLDDLKDDYAREKAAHLAKQQAKEAALKRELAEKQEKQAATLKEAALKRKKLDEQVAAQRRKDLIAANAKLTGPQSLAPSASSSAGPSSSAHKAPPTARTLEYDPFAEDEYSHVPLSSASTGGTKKARGTTNGGGAVDALSAGPGPSGSGKKSGSGSKGDREGAAAGAKKARRSKDGSDSDNDDRKAISAASTVALSRKQKLAMAFEAQMKRARADTTYAVPGQAPKGPTSSLGGKSKGSSTGSGVGAGGATGSGPGANGRSAAGPSRTSSGTSTGTGVKPRPHPTSFSNAKPPINRIRPPLDAAATGGLTRIEPKNRDHRSFDEFQADRRAKLGISASGSTGAGAGAGPSSTIAASRAGKSSSRSLSPVKGAPGQKPGAGGTINAGANGIIKKEREKVVIPTTARPRLSAPSTAGPNANGTSGKRPRQRSRSPSTSSASSSTSYSRDRDRDRDRYRDRRNTGTGNGSGNGNGNGNGKRARSITPDENNYSSVIQGLFQRPGRSGPPGGVRPRREIYSDDEDFSDDMEAGLEDIEMEDRRATRLARREDEEAEREERERRERKERMKREKMKGR